MDPFIVDCIAWALWLITWQIGGFFVRRTRWAESLWRRAQYVLPMMLGFLLIFHDRRSGRFLIHEAVYHNSAVKWAGCAMTIAGLLFSVWARFVLGRNWSGFVTLKQDHQLVTTGPYRFVRHPLYTGFLTAVLGTAITVGTGDSLVGFVIVLVGYLVKLAREEKLMIEQFGEQYVQYKKQVATLVPYIF
jgi:protein-S-isoprenylcysteine O-methyltransferase Ste14